LVRRHKDFPAPVPFGVQGLRWRPEDIIKWIDGLCSQPTCTATSGEIVAASIPEFDISTYIKHAVNTGRKRQHP
jgi:hypothetical protein